MLLHKWDHSVCGLQCEVRCCYAYRTKKGMAIATVIRGAVVINSVHAAPYGRARTYCTRLAIGDVWLTMTHAKLINSTSSSRARDCEKPLTMVHG